jgi:glycosyltransferase involved in cell wall biosynthesis
LLEKYKQKTGTEVEKGQADGAHESSGEKKGGKGIMQILLFFFNRQNVEHYRCLSRSSLFDSKYYRHKYDDLNRFFKAFPLAHYIYTGWREKRCPNEFFELFDREWYLENNPDADGLDPLLHFIETGCSPTNGLNPLFFDEYYRKQYLEGSTDDIPAILHYMTVGWQEGANPNPFFDTRFYHAENRDNIPANMNPLVHYLHFGFDEAVHPLPFFDTRYYIEDNPAVARQRLPLLYHYIRYGAEEGRNPNRFFDSGYYRKENKLEGQPGWRAFEHYVTKGCSENLRPSLLFDPVFYGEMYPEYKTSHLYPLLQYQETGVFEGNYPCREVAELVRKPVVSILTPVYNTDEHLLRRCIHSVLYQAYPHWELCLVDDGSSEGHIRNVLEEYSGLDSRIKVCFMKVNKGISAASNEAAAIATGEYIGLLDHDDELTPDALYEVVKVINEQDPDVIYTDEDLVNLESRHLEPFYKPDYNAELLLCHNYITHFLVTRRDLFETIGGFSGEYSGAQDYDLFLKLVEKSRNVMHIPKVLYHWRAHETSTSINHEQKQYANEAGRKSLAAALKRRGIRGTAENTELKFFYRVSCDLANEPLISIIGTGSGDNERLTASVQSLLQSTSYSNIEVVLPRLNGTVLSSPESVSKGNVTVKLVNFTEGMTEPQWKNRAVEEAGGEYLVFLDLTLQAQNKGWLEALLEYAQQNKIGFAGGRIDDINTDFQHQGTVPDIDNTSWYYYVSFVRDVSIHLNGMHCPQHVQYVPESLCMIRREKFTDHGGYDETFASSSFASLDLCQRLLKHHLAHVFTPHCKFCGNSNDLRQRIESIDNKVVARQKKLFQEKWFAQLLQGDPYYNSGVLADNEISVDTFLKWYAG